MKNTAYKDLLKVYYFLKEYKFDLITGITSALLALIASRYSLLIITIGLGIIILLRVRNKDFYFIALDSLKGKDQWIGSGQFEYSRASKGYSITQSGSGFIFSECLNWSDYKLSFDFKIRKTCLGVVLRAINLSNYIMMQITKDGIRPHIRTVGAWNAEEAVDAGLLFDKKISLEKWYKCQIICDKNIIYIKIAQGKNVLLDREWKISEGNIQFEYPGQDGIPIVAPPFPINLDYGSVGFRNFGKEKAVVKNLLIEKL